MAVSPSHRFGQIIGDQLEAAVLPFLQDFAERHDLYLDKNGSCPCRRGSKVTWKDLNGNSHNLDYVLERGGTPTERGVPAAFIETAWRRYTKHSRNKAQELQGAISPLLETYQRARPFAGAILAGVFTPGALTQLESLGFTILFFPYSMVVEVFERHGIDASFHERTADAEFHAKVNAWEELGPIAVRNLAAELLEVNQTEVDRFTSALEAVVSRQVVAVIALPLHGRVTELRSIEDALSFVEAYDERRAKGGLQRYEIQVRYDNGNLIEGRFRDKVSAVEFLQTYRPTSIP